LAAAQRLAGLGYRYRLNIFPGDHFTPGIFDDYRVGAAYVRAVQPERHPAEVRFTRSVTFEHAIDTGQYSDAPLAGHSVGMRFDHAWYVHDLVATDQHAGTATIDVRSYAPRDPAHTVVDAQGIDATGGVGDA